MCKITAACISLLLATGATAAPRAARLRRQDTSSASSSTSTDSSSVTSTATASTATISSTDDSDWSGVSLVAGPSPSAGSLVATASGVPQSTQSCVSSSEMASGAMLGSGSGLCAGGPGALFWQANDPTQNVVFSANLDADGTMSFGGAFMAGGRGAHIGPDANSPNPFASQGSVKVVDDKLSVVNAGSNTLALFQIDFQNPAMARMIGLPVSTMGTFPISSTINQINHNVCVLNAGDENGIVCYSINLRNGLTVIPDTTRPLNLTLSTPPANEDGTPSEVFFQPDGTKLFATVKSSGSNPGMVLAYDVDPFTFALSAQPVVTTVQSGSSITPVANSTAIFTNVIGSGFTVLSVGNATTPVSVSAPQALNETAVPGAKHNAWSEDSGVTGNYYLADKDADMVTEIAIDSKSLAGSIVKQYNLPSGGSCMDQEVATLNGNDTLYIMCAGSLTMETFSLVGPGNAVKKQSFDLKAAAQQAGITLQSGNVAGSNAFFQG